jgi:hypothetical protein
MQNVKFSSAIGLDLLKGGISNNRTGISFRSDREQGADNNNICCKTTSSRGYTMEHRSCRCAYRSHMLACELCQHA